MELPKTNSRLMTMLKFFTQGPSSQLQQVDGKVTLTALTLGIALFCFASVLAAGRSVWLDEGMYLANLNENWRAYFHPLPFYDQASPPLVSIVFSTVLNLAAGDLHVLRVCVFLAFVLSLAGFGWQLSKAFQPRLAAFAVLFLVSNGLVVQYATEIKHYGVEAIVSLLLISLFAWSMQRKGAAGPRAAYLFAAVSVALSFLSYAVLIVATALMLDRAVLSEDRTTRKHWWASLGVFAAAYGMLYLFVFKGLLFFNLNNYRAEYGAFLLKDNFLSAAFWKHTIQLLSALFQPDILFAFVPLAAIVAVLSARSDWWKDRFAPARVTVLLAGGILSLSALGVYPIFRPRHFVFTLPFLALTVGWAVHQLIHRYGRKFAPGTYVIAAVLLMACARNAFIAYRGDFDFERTRELYAFIAGRPENNVALWVGFQPSFEFYSLGRTSRMAGKAVLGTIGSATGLLPATDRTVEDYSRVAQAAGGWAATIHLWIVRRFDVYTDWLVSRVPTNEPTLLAIGHFDPYRNEVMMRSIEKRHCLSEVVFQDRGVRALRLVCPVAE